MKRSNTDIIRTATILQREAERLPDESSFGDDNSDEKTVLLDWSKQLRDFAMSKVKPESMEVDNWLKGKFSEIDDCL